MIGDELDRVMRELAMDATRLIAERLGREHDGTSIQLSREQVEQEFGTDTQPPSPFLGDILDEVFGADDHD